MKPCLQSAGIAGDGHRLDHRVGIALDQHTVLERPGLGLVGVADHIVRMGRLARHGLPLDAHRERGAATPQDPGVLDLAHDAARAELDRAPQRLVAALGAVVVEALRLDAADPAQQPQSRLAGLRRRGNIGGATGSPSSAASAVAMSTGASTVLARLLPGHGQQRGRRAVALAQARALQPRCVALQRLALRPGALLEQADQLGRSRRTCTRCRRRRAAPAPGAARR